MNPAVEAQAVGRVHRLGQKREVEITRLIVEDSVETRMLKYLELKYGISSSGATPETEKDDGDDGDDDDDNDDEKSSDEEKCDKTEQVGVKTVDEGAKVKSEKAKEKKAVENVVVGNLLTDKAQANLEQFDLLFGVEELVKEAEEQEPEQQQDAAMPDANGDGTAVPDIVSSYGF
jgi:hypothetical protein